MYLSYLLSFSFNTTTTTDIYTLSLHDALPIYHILLTLEACSNLHLDVVAIVINRMPKRPSKSQRLIASTVRQLTGIRRIFSIPEFRKQPEPVSIGSILDDKWQILDSLRP